MSGERIILTSAVIRSALRNKFPSLAHLPDPFGAIAGTTFRENNLAEAYATSLKDDNTNQIEDDWNDILGLSLCLPMPFWNGIHPTILKQMSAALHESNNPFWDTRIGIKPSSVKSTLLVPTEPGIDAEVMNEQASFILKNLPKGSLSTIFFTNGKNTQWQGIPLASAFSEDPHQMSIPLLPTKFPPGFNTLLLTTTPSTTVPSEWKSPFPGEKPENTPDVIRWMNMHQIGHCLVAPTCWEYIDRSYSLFTPRELLTATKSRLECLNQWFTQYYGLSPEGQYIPDTTSYLYEIKIIQRAIIAAKFNKHDYSISDEIFWYKGYHEQEIASQLNVDTTYIRRGIDIMDTYLNNNHSSRPYDSALNSLMHSTDFGTHPIEEIIVDIIAQTRLGLLPQRYLYWNEYTSRIFKAWERWEFEGLDEQTIRAPARAKKAQHNI